MYPLASHGVLRTSGHLQLGRLSRLATKVEELALLRVAQRLVRLSFARKYGSTSSMVNHTYIYIYIHIHRDSERDGWKKPFQTRVYIYI